MKTERRIELVSNQGQVIQIHLKEVPDFIPNMMIVDMVLGVSKDKIGRCA